MSLISRIGSLLVSAIYDDRPLDRGLKRSSKNLTFFQRQTQAFSKSITSSIGRVAGIAAVGVAVGSAARDAVRTISTFEQSVADLASISGRSVVQLEALKQSAIEIGARSSFSASEVVKLQTELAKLGFAESEILDSTEAIGNFSVALGTDAASAATLAGSVLRAFGKDTKETESVVNTLAVATTKSALDFEKLNTSLSIVAPVAKGANVSIERTTALLGVLSDRGLDASTSGTSLRNIFLELSSKGLTYNEAMDKINSSTDKLNTANKLFGTRGATTALILAENEGAVRSLEASITGVNGALDEMTNTRLNTLNGKLTILSSAWARFTFSVDQGDGIISRTFKAAADSATNVLNQLVALNKEGFAGFNAVTEKIRNSNSRAGVTSQLSIAGSRGRTSNTFQDQTIRLEQTLKGLRDQLGSTIEGSDEYNQITQDIATTQAKLNALKNAYNGIIKKETDNTKDLVKQQRDLLTSTTSIGQGFTTGRIGEFVQDRRNRELEQRRNSPLVQSTQERNLLAGVNTTFATPTISNIEEWRAQNEAIDQQRESIEKLKTSYASLGNAIGSSLEQGANSFSSYGSQVLGTVQQLIGSQIKLFVAKAIANSGLGPLGLLLAPAIGGLASGLINTAINSATVPKLAKGGVLDRPTLFMGGEYAGASNNKEIVTPQRIMADTMRKVLQSQSHNLTVYSRIRSRDIVLSNRQGDFDKKRVG